ncbi:MAG: replication-associated recombination protein A [Candidatus Magasanikbacteria bacterium]|nr:replication-associated recombination protein A [Candidatus Magasanikbacteria bacterium]
MLTSAPLAERLRPRTFAEFVGQMDIVGQGKLLRKLIEGDQLSSLIFWGPPGVGKTTLAHIIAEHTKSRFISLSATGSGKEDLRQVIEQATMSRRLGERTVLFIDEIHRWNKAQQDALLPHVEKGHIIFIGATTENPSFEIIGALLSRSRVFILQRLSAEDIIRVLQRALTDSEHGLGNYPVTVEDKTLRLLAELAGGDARVALNGLELAVVAAAKSPAKKKKTAITADDIKEALQRTHFVFDKNGEEFYNLISALHKSMRGSDPDAALYWLARMLEGGADPLYVARRVVRFASEDIGMANSEALIQATAAFQACHQLGMPECAVHLAQAVVYCAKSAKSNLLYTAYSAAAEDARATSHLGAPLHLRNASTEFMKDIGYGKGYKYPPDFAIPVEQEYLPAELKGKKYLVSKKIKK